MKKEELIEHCLQEVQKKGIQIIRGGAMYDWVGKDGKMSDVPTGCDGFGAVLVMAGKAKPGFPEDWITILQKELSADYYWIWRFNMGFGVGNILTLRKDVGNKEVEFDDPVSKAGYRLAKKYCRLN